LVKGISYEQEKEMYGFDDMLWNVRIAHRQQYLCNVYARETRKKSDPAAWRDSRSSFNNRLSGFNRTIVF
jgi:hypothetical protein